VIGTRRVRRLESVVDAVGGTPLVRLRVVTKNAPDVPVYAKLEFVNPGGSVKDRAALRMIQDALETLRLVGAAMDAEKHPWVKGKITIKRDVAERIDSEARAAFDRDEESCGLLVGPADEPLLVDAIVPMENRANELHKLDPETYPRTGRMYFDVDPMKFERSVRDGEACGRPVKVLYHSHLDVGAYFSETDAQAATMGGVEPSYDLAYLVTSVRAGVVDDQKLFVWDPERKSFVEVPLTIE
jgi:proteasome lid subunit RPN8/RPN11